MSPAEKLDADARHARIVNAVPAYQPPHRTRHHRPRSSIHDDNPPLYADISQTALITTDEKCELAQGHATLQPLDDDNTPPPPISPNSSVVSIPSTRLTDLTSMQTGETISHSVLGRGSLERWTSRPTRPPSYVDTMPRAPSPVASGTRHRSHSPPVIGVQAQQDEVWLHPVMHTGWLQALQRESAAEERRDTSRTFQR